MADLDIYLFGVGRIHHRGAGTDVHPAPAVRAMLGYLALHRGRTHHRDVLAGTFWPDVSEACARSRLSTTLWRVRRILDPEGGSADSDLTTNRQGGVTFTPDAAHWLDVAVFEESAHRVTGHETAAVTATDAAAFERAQSLYEDDFLEGIDLPWLLIERERLHQLKVSANRRLMDYYIAAGQPDRAVGAGQRILEHDPLREDVHRTLIRIFAMSQQRARALRQFDTCRDALREELGVMPLPETVAVAATVSNGAPLPERPREGIDTRAAVELVESAAATLGMAARELEQVVRSLKALTSGS